MSSTTTNNDFFKSNVLGHPSGLFVLFFTEMWERFSFYGMRVLLVQFLTMALVGYNPGWEWTTENATALFGTYAMLLYLTPIVGGIIADKFTGYRVAVVIGAIIMTLGHAAMAIETEFWLYVGLGLLVLGTGFFKPNMTSILSEMYKDVPEKKDGAYTIFYMGVNAGAFFGMMLCGYLAEKIGWAYGFGLAGIFMLLGTFQFWLAKPLFGGIGDKPSKVVEVEPEQAINEKSSEFDKKPEDSDKRNPFTKFDMVLIVLASIIGLGYAINDPISKIGGLDLFKFAEIGSGDDLISGQVVMSIVGLILFLILVIGRILRYERVVRDRMIAVIIFAFFTVFFWLSFEQGASSLVIFARDNVNRVLSGSSATAFNIVNTLLTVVPLALVSWVLFLLGKQTWNKTRGSNIVLIVCFLGVWAMVGWMLNRDMNTRAYEVQYSAIKTAHIDKETKKQKKNDDGELVFDYKPVTEMMTVKSSDNVVTRKVSIAEPVELNLNDKIKIIVKNNKGDEFGYLTEERLAFALQNGEKLNRDNGIISAQVTKLKEGEVEVTVSWFSILNSFFIIAFANLISKWWESKYNPSAAMKYGFGLIIMAIGFGLLALGAYGLKEGMKVSMVWLILAYLFHTLGELCLSPVGLSYVSKLVPPRMIAFMFGMWYLAIAIGNKLAAVVGGQIEHITQQYSLSVFFLIFTIVPVAAGLLIMGLNPLIKKLMHGVK
ncbi:MAG: peptide MFS transporter [Flavobacteriales bacterium]